MSLSRFVYDPFADFDHLFDEAFAARTSGNNNSRHQNQVAQRGEPRFLRPKMDVHEDEKSNLVTATFELPGLKKEDVNIDFQNDLLTISGESKISSDRDENGYAVRERRYGRFARSIPLPQGVKSEEIKASLDNGILTVTFPKTSPEQVPKKITIS
ncbi:HSP20-like chaperone [Abortiporus biennis]|nr:HSP20-like chaperone [Abortiporus biennis]